MFGKHLRCNLVLTSVIILQFLCWSVEAQWKNNQTLIDIVNKKNTTWKAGVNKIHLPARFAVRRRERTPTPTLESKPTKTPARFDARNRWKKCSDVIGQIRKQGHCASGWAVATASMLSDRTCIATNGTKRVHLSAEDVMTCCGPCAPANRNSCEGAFPEDAVRFWTKEGIVTGGELNTKESCKPYSLDSYHGKTLKCTKECTNKGHFKEYEEDKHKGRVVYKLKDSERAIKSEIFKNGPVVSTILVFSDFRQYRTGVYRFVAGEFVGMHTVKIVGWGREARNNYWLVANTWGEEFGLKGYVKYLRGANQGYIERYAVAGSMYDVLSAAKAQRQIAASCTIKRSSFAAKAIFISVFCIWVLSKEAV